MKFTVTANSQFPEINEYSVKGGAVGFYGYVFKGLRNIQAVMPADYKPLTFYSVLRNKVSRKTVRVDKPALSIVNSWYDNFYHFAWETLVKLYLLRDHLDTATVVFPAERRKFHDQWLALLGIRDITYVNRKEHIVSPQVISSNFLEPGMKDEKAILEGFRDWVIARMDKEGLLEDKSKYPAKIFITRTKVRYRNIVNLEQLHALVTRYGYTVVELEDYTIAQQVNFFYHAEDIVGIHGAGFAYIGFSKAPVLDIIVDNFISLWFEKMSGILGTGYEYLRTKGVPNDFPDKRPGYHDMDVDLVKLEEKLKERNR